jgi:hypothetical protein
LKQTAEAIRQLGDRLQVPLKPDVNWLRVGLQGFLEPPNAQLFETGRASQHRIGLNFVGFLRRTKAIPWVTAWYLYDQLQNYFCWCQDRKISPSRLDIKEIEAFIVQRSRGFFYLTGTSMLAMIQSILWFSEYLKSAGKLSAPNFEQMQLATRRFYDTGRNLVDPCDPAYRIYPTFERLVRMPPA